MRLKLLSFLEIPADLGDLRLGQGSARVLAAIFAFRDDRGRDDQHGGKLDEERSEGPRSRDEADVEEHEPALRDVIQHRVHGRGTA
jgi:hypothetical protein